MPGGIPWRPLLAIALLGALATLGVSQWLFPVGSAVVDERVYIQEGRALLEGHLVLDPSFHPDHDPFFTAPNDRGELVFKYTQVWPAVLGLSHRLSGSERPAVVLVGFSGVLAVGLLTHALFRRRRVTLLGAGATAMSPAWLVVSATYLSYGMSASLSLGAAALLLAASNRSAKGTTARLGGVGARLAVAGGFVGGLAVFTRPLDAVVVISSFGVLAMVRARRHAPTIALAAAIGAAAPLGAMLAVNRRITGSAFTLGYSMVGPRDRLGFGDRLDIHDGVPYDYTPGKALLTLREGAALTLRWSLGGPLLAVAAAAAFAALVWRRSLTGLALAIAIVTVPAAYVFVWGAWNGYIRLRVGDLIGPFYWLPSVLMLGIAAAWGWEEVIRPRLSSTRRSRVALTIFVPGLVAALTASAMVAPSRSLRSVRSELVAASARLDSMRGPEPSVSLIGGNGLGADVAAYNTSALDGPVVYAIDRLERRLDVLARFPDRAVRRLANRYVLAGRPGVVEYRDGLGFDRDPVVERLSEVSGSSLQLDVRFGRGAGAAPTGLRLMVRRGSRAWTWPVTQPGATVVLAADGSPTADGRPGSSEAPPRGADIGDGRVCAGVSPGVGSVSDEVCFAAQTSPGAWRAAVPGQGLTAFVVAGSAAPLMLEADVSDRLSVTLGAS